MEKKFGRPSKNKSGTGEAKITAFRLSHEMFNRLDACAKKMRVTRTAIVEFGIDMALDALEQELENEKED